MKFGSRLKEELIPAWEDNYVEYKLLKKQLKHLDERQSALAFGRLLEVQLAKVTSFMRLQQALIGEEVELDFLPLALEPPQGPAGPERGAVGLPGDLALARCQKLETQIQSFRDYVQLNQAGLRKIVKKFDKRFQTVFSDVYREAPIVLPFSVRDVEVWMLGPARHVLAAMSQWSLSPVRPLGQARFWVEELRVGCQLASAHRSSFDPPTQLRLELCSTAAHDSLVVKNTFIDGVEGDTDPVVTERQTALRLRRAYSIPRKRAPVADDEVQIPVHMAAPAGHCIWHLSKEEVAVPQHAVVPWNEDAPPTSKARASEPSDAVIETPVRAERSRRDAGRGAPPGGELVGGGGAAATSSRRRGGGTAAAAAAGCGLAVARDAGRGLATAAAAAAPGASAAASAAVAPAAWSHGGGAHLGNGCTAAEPGAYRDQAAPGGHVGRAPPGAGRPSGPGPAAAAGGERARWWKEVHDVCPLSGFPVAMLPYPPFKLRLDPPQSSPVFVDSQYLVLRVLASWDFGVLGRALDAADVCALDGHMQKCKLGPWRLGKALRLSAEGRLADLADLRAKARRKLDALRHIQRSRLGQGAPQGAPPGRGEAAGGSGGRPGAGPARAAAAGAPGLWRG